MGYPEQFRNYREARGYSHAELAARAKRHRNTVANVETGRPVKFATLLHLMESMGYKRDSNETKALALLWLESITGVQVMPTEVVGLAGRSRNEKLHQEIARRKLAADDIDVLTFAARHHKVLNALRAIRDLVPATDRFA